MPGVFNAERLAPFKADIFHVFGACFGSDVARLLFVIQGQLLGCRGGDEAASLDSADRPNVAPEEFKRQENKQAF